MIPAAREWYAARSRREQMLIAAMLALAVVLLAWLLVIRQLAAAQDRALERHLEAVDRHGRVMALADAIRAGNSGRRLDPSVDIQLLVTESAGSSGVTLAGVDPQGPGRVSVTISGGAAPHVTEWLRGLEERGLAIEELRMTLNGQGGVDVSARLATS